MATGRVAPGGQREVLVVLLVALVVVLTALVGPLAPGWHDAPAWLDLDVSAPPVPTQAAGPSAPPADLGTGHAAPAWLGDAVRGLAIAALAAVAFLLIRFAWRLLRDRLRGVDLGGAGDEPGGAEAFGDLDDVTQAALQEGLVDAGRALRADVPPGDAVIAAWLALERAAGRGGIVRDPAQTATEFTLALLDRTPAEPGAARTLLGLYHRARFSEHEVVPGDVAAAHAALAALAVALPGSAGQDGTP